MQPDDRQRIIEAYIKAYNAFDVERMVALMHPDITFRNYSNGQLNLSTNGIAAFRRTAEQANLLFSSRCQQVTHYAHVAETTSVDIDYEGVLAADLPNGAKAGDIIELTGKSIFGFKDGLISLLYGYG